MSQKVAGNVECWQINNAENPGLRTADNFISMAALVV